MMENSPSRQYFEFLSAKPEKFRLKTAARNRKCNVAQSCVSLEVSLDLNLRLGSSVHCGQKDSGLDLSLSLGSPCGNTTRRKVSTRFEGPLEDDKDLGLSLSLAGSGEENKNSANSVPSGSVHSTVSDHTTVKQKGFQDSKRKRVDELNLNTGKKRRINKVDANSTKNSPVMAPLPIENLVNPAKEERPVPEDHVNWDFIKKLTSSDVNSLCRLMLGKSVVEDKLFPLLTDYAVQKIKEDKYKFPVLDSDTNSMYQMELKKWKSGSYVFNNGRSLDFVKRRGLKKNDTIRLQWDRSNACFIFRLVDHAGN